MSQENLAHAAGAEEFHHPIWSDGGYLWVAPCVRQKTRGLLSRRPGKIVRHNMGNQRFHFFSQSGIAGASLIQKARSLCRLALERRGKYLINFFPALWLHLGQSGFSSRCKNALARSH